MDKNEAKEKIKKLVEKYETAVKVGAVRSYTEEETKKDFILPLFEALGWSVYEKDDVTAEESQSGGRVDYGFYINGHAKFYLEAKALKEDIDREDFADKAIKYSWNKGVAWAVLTDFERLKVFNAQAIEKSLADKLFFDVPYTDYLSRLDQLWWLSKDAFKEDVLDKEASKVGKKLQKIPVSTLLSKDLNKSREILMEGFSKCNPKVDRTSLDEGVQKLLDRLIFMRVVEDRGIEPHVLLSLIRERKSDEEVYQSLVKKFREFDGFYDSDLFAEHALEKWEEYSGSVKKVIDLLHGKKGYYEYDFKVMPADVLGAVYENYLGYRLSQSKKGVTLGEDDKKRKEQGIYYTPTFIVDYIVRNALKPVLDKCDSITDLKNIKVLDPACGSGSFLIKALEVIYEKHYELGNRRSVETKRTILLENIYGVDLDEQAVEIARLNLLLCALDGKIKLPMLSKNIKNGNSLISGTDEELKKYFGKNFRDKKPFNWQEEFPEVFKQGGFDVIVGNPPYIKEFVNKSAFEGLHQSPYYQGKMDIWTMFACISIDFLRDGGVLSFIAPSNWVGNAGASIFREKVLKEGELKSFVDFGDYKVFEQAGIQTMIFVFEKGEVSAKYEVDYLKILDKEITEDKLISELFLKKEKIEIEPKKMIGGSIVFSREESSRVFDKIKNKQNFRFTEKEVGQGIVCPQEYVINKHLFVLKNANAGDGIFVLKSSEVMNLHLGKKEGELIKPFYTTEEIARYYASKENRSWIIYSNSSVNKNIDKYPKIKQHLQKYTSVITSDFRPFGLHRARNEKFFIGPSIFSIRKTEKPQFSYVDFPCYVSQTYFVVSTDRANLKYLTGILNSQLIYFWLRNRGKLQGDMLQIDKEPLLEIPVCIGDIQQQKAIMVLVDKMIELNRKFHNAEENSNKWNSLKSEIEKTDKKIDGEIYKLYGLTEPEIKTVEGVGKN